MSAAEEQVNETSGQVQEKVEANVEEANTEAEGAKKVIIPVAPAKSG